MLRRTPFKRPEYTPPPVAPMRRVERSGTYAHAEAVAAPKPQPCRNEHLLAMARDQPCLLRLPSVCRGGTETTVAAHSNLLMHGKAKSRKADDQYSVWACARCHAWLDSSYSANYEDKVNAFMLAHVRQVEQWRLIAGDVKQPTKNRLAAMWALEQLNATPTVPESPL